MVSRIRQQAYTAARQAGLDTDTSDAVSRRVVERCRDGSPGKVNPPTDESVKHVIERTIQEHAQP